MPLLIWLTMFATSQLIMQRQCLQVFFTLLHIFILLIICLLHKSFSMSVTQSVEPRTYKEACQHDHWLKANLEPTKKLVSMIIG
jgi:hypothetical protein